MKARSLFIIWFCVCSSSLFAQDVIGTTILGGKRVELLSDNSWRFAELPSNGGKCVPINTSIEFCGSIFDWRPSSTQGTDFLRLFRHDDKNYAGIIFEDIGSADGMTQETLRNIIIDNAATVSGVPVNEVPVLSVETANVDSIPAETVTYGAVVQSLDFVYRNTIIIGDRHSLQLVTWSLNNDLSEKHIQLHETYLEAIRLTLPEKEF